MTEIVAKLILLLSVFVCLTHTVALKGQVSQEPLNSVEEANISSRTNSVSNKAHTAADNHDQVSDVENRVLDNFDHRYPDGSYEFRYELADGQARYERGYFIRLNKHKSLVVVGYYSYRMPDGQYITVFYNADQFGYRQNQAITRDTLPNLPRSIEIPEAREYQSDDDDVTTDATTTKSIPDQDSSTTKRSHL